MGWVCVGKGSEEMKVQKSYVRGSAGHLCASVSVGWSETSSADLC